MRRRFLAAVAAGLTAAVVASAQSPEPSPHVGPVSFVNPASHTVIERPSATQTLVADAAEPTAGPDRSVWATGEYLVWFTRNQRTPALVASVPDTAAPAGTTVRNLFPSGDGRRFDFDAQSGFRARVGATVGPLYGFDVGGFALERKDTGDTFASSGSPSLARPYTRALDGTQQYLYTALPGQYGGRVSVFADTRTWGIDGNARVEWYRLLVDRSELLAGFRYLNIDESLVINDRSDLAGGVTSAVRDSFRVENQFYGAQLGLHLQLLNVRGVSLEVIDKFAFGSMNQRVTIAGSNSLTGRADQATGLYAQATNSGTYSRGIAAAVNEFTLNLGYCFTANVRAHVGYNLLYASSVVRPGQTIDRVVNDSNIRYVANPPADPNNRRPSFDFGRSSSDFWVQGLNFGLTFMY